MHFSPIYFSADASWPNPKSYFSLPGLTWGKKNGPASKPVNI